MIAGEGKRERERERWVEYFEELLNRPTPKDPVDIQPASYDLPIVSIVPTKTKCGKQSCSSTRTPQLGGG